MLQTEFIKHPLIKENIVEKREYQVKIASNCIKRNTLVCLPTGLGKTIIAALVTAEKLISNPDKKVVMLAPTRPLVIQHFESFKKIFNLSPKDLVAITGNIPPTQRKDLWNKRLIFSTPQVFMNDLILGYVDVKTISLLIFDEAHRATGDYAYTFIAERYAQEPGGLILGLTASPGVSKEEIEKICKNLFIKHIEARTISSPDVKTYIKRINVKWIKVDLPKTFFQIKECFIKFIKEQIKDFKNYGIIKEINVEKLRLKDILKAKEDLKKSLNIQKNVLKHLYLSLNSIVYCIKAIELLETQGLNTLKAYLKDLVERVKAKPIKSGRIFLTNPSIIEAINLIDQAIAEGLDHPKLLKLKEIIKDSLNKKIKRIIIFTNYRTTATKLVQALNELNGVSASRLVGQSSKNEDKGLSQKEQIKILEDFKLGKYNVLIATQIGEEGLDIIDCDEVIFYDSVPSAIRFIQRKGRTGRKWPGKVIVLLTSKTRDEAYYWIAKRKEKTMAQALKDIVSMENKHDQLKIEDFIKKIEDKNKSFNQKIKIIIDSREASSSIIKELSRLDIDLELKSLDIGDYVLSDRIVVERKTIEDFITSIMDGRLFNQLIKLKSAYEFPLLIIEGDFSHASSAISFESFIGAIVSTIIDYKTPIIWTKNPIETASLLFHIAKREQLKEKHEPRIRYEVKPVDPNELKEYIVAGLPHINKTLAKRLLKKFKTVEKVFTASIKELQEVNGIGEKISKEIKKVLTEEYEEKE